jgi:kynureninase
VSRPATGADPLAAWRVEFPILARTSYLVSHSLGAMPRAARARLLAYADLWEERGVEAWPARWWGMPIEVGNLLARLLGAPEGSVSMHQNVTLMQAIVLSAFDWRGARPRLVCCALDFPSCLYLYEGLRAQGAEVVRVPSDDGLTMDPERVAAAVDERTAAVCCSHVVYRSGALFDLAPVVEKARRVGAVTILDAYQAVGTVPIDVRALGVDVLTGGSVKWLCGGPGAGYLYVNPETRPRLTPRLTGWMAHPEPFSFDPGPMRPVDGPYRYLNGTPGIPALYAASAGYEILLEVGVEAVREKSLRLTQRILDRAGARGWQVNTPRDGGRRGGTVSLGVPDAGRVSEELARRGVHVDHRPGVGLRLGPHFYNTEDDVDRALAAIEEIVGEGRPAGRAGGPAPCPD